MKKSLLFSFNLIGTIGFATAVPLAGLGLLGRYLDRHFDTSPYLMLTGMAIATVLIYFVLKQIVRDAIRDFEKLNK